MKKLPCEKAIWDTIPIIRKEIAFCMIRDFGLNQTEAAIKLNITPAAVCQYKCNKRADKQIKNPLILNEIKISTNNLINNGITVLESEICRLCKIINKK